MHRFFKSLVMFIGLVHCFFVFGQEEKSLSKKGDVLPIKIFKTTNNDLTLEQVLSNNSAFLPLELFSEKSKPSITYWVQIDLQNEIEKIELENTWYLRFRQYGYTSIFYKKNSQINEHKVGRFENQPKRSSALYSQGIPFNQNYIFNHRYLYLKIKRVAYFETVKNWKFYYYSKQKIELVQDFYSQRDLKHLIPIYLFTGICLIMFLLTIMYYAYTKRSEFLFYALYILFLFFIPNT